MRRLPNDAHRRAPGLRRVQPDEGRPVPTTSTALTSAAKCGINAFVEGVNTAVAGFLGVEDAIWRIARPRNGAGREKQYCDDRRECLQCRHAALTRN